MAADYAAELAELSFLHWAVEPGSIAHLYPAGAEPDTLEGSSFVGVVPFQMRYFGTFLETNVRLYSVDRTGRRGVVFLSLDTNRLDMVAAGRWFFGVPYAWAIANRVIVAPIPQRCGGGGSLRRASLRYGWVMR